MGKNKINFSVVIPAYNESENIKSIIEELLSITDKIESVGRVQVIVVDDHSSDNTYDVVSQIKDQRTSCLRLSRRSGSHTALRAGIREATGDIVLCISADGQDDPSCLENMLEKWCSGAKIVWALRKDRNVEPWHIKNLARLFYKFLKWFGGNVNNRIDLYRADFYLLDKVVVRAINSCLECNTSLFGLIAWLGFNQDFVEYERRIRKHGESKWNFRSRLQLAKDWMVAFSGIPLRVASSIGIITAILGIFYAIFVVMNKLFFGNPVPGYASIVVLVLVLSGVQLTILGIIGEYIWRNLGESRKRPLYFIEKKTTNNEN